MFSPSSPSCMGLEASTQIFHQCYAYWEKVMVLLKYLHSPINLIRSQIKRNLWQINSILFYYKSMKKENILEKYATQNPKKVETLSRKCEFVFGFLGLIPQGVFFGVASHVSNKVNCFAYG